MTTIRKFIFLCLLSFCQGNQPVIIYGPREGRIVNGVDAGPEEFPFQVSLHNIKDGSAIHNCGGSILNEHYVITAAHCIVDEKLNAYDLEVHVGLLLDKPDKVYGVESKYYHDQYDPNPYGSHDNDIGLVKVKEAFAFNDKVSAVALPDRTKIVPESTNAVISGWGRTIDHRSEPFSNHLQKLTVTIVNNKDCESNFRKLKIHKTHLCSEEPDTTVDDTGACSGDSGGPLTINGNELIGIISWIYRRCGRVGDPTVYTRVSEYITWIEDHAK